MSLTILTKNKLNDCGCCEGNAPLTPKQIYNRPRLPQIDYRVGTHSAFKLTMLTRLSSGKYPLLNSLKARNGDDYTIALLDAWACVCDNICFYSERAINECYLLTADERRSLIELGRLIGYQLNPGVAAATQIAFTMDEAPGAPDMQVESTVIDSGTKIQSTPGPGEDPQLFETEEPITARVEWNAIKPRIYHPHPVKKGIEQFIFRGVDLNLNKGDLLVLIKNNFPIEIGKIFDLEIDNVTSTTTISIVNSPKKLTPSSGIKSQGNIENLKQLAHAKPDKNFFSGVVNSCWVQEDILTLVNSKKWNIRDFLLSINNYTLEHDRSLSHGAHVFKKTVSLFGNNAVKQVEYDPKTDRPKLQKDWKEWKISSTEESTLIFLDAEYRDITSNSYVVIQKSGSDLVLQDFYRVSAANTTQRNDYGISGKITKLTTREWWHPNPKDDITKLRNTIVHIQSERLLFADIPDLSPVEGDKIVLDGAYLKLKPGQLVVISGERNDLPGIKQSEVRELESVWLNGGYTEIVFHEALEYEYVRDSVTINANVASASHGETVREVLGSGDASKTYQRFRLKQTPLTYIQSDTPGGSQSTLEVRVNKILWHQVDSLLWQGPEDHVYVTRTDDDGHTTVQFGDGVHGARLPTGENNVRAEYRKGIGLGGLLEAGQLNILMTRPLGLKDAINPVPATGADDPESLSQARENMPRSVLTLGRVVSLQDYEDFANNFVGIAKAKASWMIDANEQHVFITLAGPNGVSIDANGNTFNNLFKALRQVGDPFVNIILASYRPTFFKLSAGIMVHPDHQPDLVLEMIRTRLKESFAFVRRQFVQPVMLSEIISIMQHAPGVVAVDVDTFHRSDAFAPTLETRLLAEPAQAKSGKFNAAELLLIDSAPIDLRLMA